jgi:hypothetical protein
MGLLGRMIWRRCRQVYAYFALLCFVFASVPLSAVQNLIEYGQALGIANVGVVMSSVSHGLGTLPEDPSESQVDRAEKVRPYLPGLCMSDRLADIIRRRHSVPGGPLCRQNVRMPAPPTAEKGEAVLEAVQGDSCLYQLLGSSLGPGDFTPMRSPPAVGSGAAVHARCKHHRLVAV